MKPLSRRLGYLSYDDPYLKLAYDGDSKRKEKHSFYIRPNSTIKSILDKINEVDSTVKSGYFMDTDGFRIHESSPLSLVMDGKTYILFLNDKNKIEFIINRKVNTREFTNSGIRSPKRSIIPLRIGNDSKNKGFQELCSKYENLSRELSQMDEMKEILSQKANKKSKIVLLALIAYMGFQSSFLAYLTFIELSWDIMEPITYFITYFTNILCVIYYTMTRKEFSNEELDHSQVLKSLIQNAKKYAFDLKRYEELQKEFNRTKEKLEDFKKL